jgi:hypothetical protein
VAIIAQYLVLDLESESDGIRTGRLVLACHSIRISPVILAQNISCRVSSICHELKRSSQVASARGQQVLLIVLKAERSSVKSLGNQMLQSLQNFIC